MTRTTTAHTIDDMTVSITRNDNHKVAYVTIEQEGDTVIMTKTDIRAIAELLIMDVIVDGCEDIVRR